ncbi:hypothetical protein Cgig2_029816 [Carnegiea gigantea]|uniref:Uncharacterized protein n=1 Tax=Carnegiea gigantea TaxID=171969 RepID=A0A9Q1GX80_9CARY|nr:hypothetical protein Cgig2_029816 [Carnegiea gigantea]
MSDLTPSQTRPSSAASQPSVPPQNANLFSASQFSHDDGSAGPQLPTDLDGDALDNPGNKAKEAIPTFSRAVKLGMGSLHGGSVSRTGAEPPKVTAVVMPEATPTIIISDTSAVGGCSVPTDGHSSESAKRSSDLETGLSTVPTFIPDQDSDLPLDKDDEMDIFLNLEGDNDPQRSSDSSK